MGINRRAVQADRSWRSYPRRPQNPPHWKRRGRSSLNIQGRKSLGRSKEASDAVLFTTSRLDIILARELAKYNKMNNEALALIAMSIIDDIIPKVQESQTAHESWKILRKLYEKPTKTRILHLNWLVVSREGLFSATYAPALLVGHGDRLWSSPTWAAKPPVHKCHRQPLAAIRDPLKSTPQTPH
eukprot:Gb_27813 [translate_table: standard]